MQSRCIRESQSKKQIIAVDFFANVLYDYRRESQVIYVTKYEQLEMLMADSNGYLIVSKAVESGISKQYVNEFIKKNH